MATVTSRINANNNSQTDQYNSHWSPTWRNQDDGGTLAHSEEFEFWGDWYGGIYNKSLRFPNITIPKGATITSAKISFIRNSGGGSDRTLHYKFIGVDEDNTGVFSSGDTARTRTHTTASVDWDFLVSGSGNIGDNFDTSDIKDIIQEIIDRSGWSSGNALALYLYDDGSTIGDFFDYKYYSSYPSDAPLLTITYEYGGSASVSPSASASPSLSPSSSVSPSSSTSVSVSPSISLSPSPSPMPPAFRGLKIAKPHVNVLTNSDPDKLIFSSEYGTLKYLSKQEVNISFDASTGDIAAKGTYTHNKNKYLFAEVYVRVYTGSTPSGNYQYCPFYGAGATILYSANFRITKNTIEVYGMISGVSTSVWHFDFIIFVYNNDLKLT